MDASSAHLLTLQALQGFIDLRSSWYVSIDRATCSVELQEIFRSSEMYDNADLGTIPPSLRPFAQRVLTFATGPHWVGDICRATAHECLWALTFLVCEDSFFLFARCLMGSPPDYGAVFRQIESVRESLKETLAGIEAKTVRTLIQCARIEFARAYPSALEAGPVGAEAADLNDSRQSPPPTPPLKPGFRNLIAVVDAATDGIAFADALSAFYPDREAGEGAAKALYAMIERANTEVLSKSKRRMVVDCKVSRIVPTHNPR